MKLVKTLVIAFVASFALGSFGVLAFISDTAFFAGWEIPGWRGSITSSEKEKNDYSGEVIHTIGTYFDRDINYKINDLDGYGSTSWRTIDVGSSEVVTRINTENTANIPVLFAGTKTLTLRTNVNWLGSTTSYSGSWWLSEADHDAFY